jgi:amidase
MGAVQDPYNAFCSHASVRIAGAADGPLAGLTFAAKDLFDVAGHATGGGNPDWLATHGPAQRSAPVVQKLLDAGATLVGKTHTDELSRGIFGENAHYGTPINPSASGRIPGGSSSGSAAAVAGQLVDFALGTDTGGSVRVPAAFCGIYGIRPTHGRLKLEGVIPQAPSFDTIGWFARDARLLARLAEVLTGIAVEASRCSARLIIAEDAFAVAEDAARRALSPSVERLAELFSTVERRPLSTEPLAAWFRHQGAIQGREAWATFGDWIDRTNPRFGFEVADNFLRGKSASDDALAAANAFRAERRAEFAALLGNDALLCLPTTPFPAPLRGQPRSVMWEKRVPVITLTCIAGMVGAPQITIPVARVDGAPIGLSLVGPPGSDGTLLATACEFEELVSNRA